MTNAFEEPTTPMEIRLTEELALVRNGMAQERQVFADELERLRAMLVRLEEMDQITAERNTLRQQLSETEQERVRLYNILAETVAGVQEWVPDLSPVPQPPATIPPEAHAAWIADQIAQRRSTWDVFVNRVVTQAGV